MARRHMQKVLTSTLIASHAAIPHTLHEQVSFPTLRQGQQILCTFET